MRSVNIHHAKTHLSQLVEEAARGEAFVIAKAGRPMVKVVPIVPEEHPRRRLIGSMQGEFALTEEFDSMDAEIERLFNYDPIEP